MKYFERSKARIEIVPMIDIMLFLLVFFVMLSMQMIPAKGLRSELPHSSTATQLPKPKLIIALAYDGSIELDGERMNAEQLTARLRAKGEPGSLQVSISGSKSASVQHLVSVMDACRQAGVVHIGLAAKDSVSQ